MFKIDDRKYDHDRPIDRLAALDGQEAALSLPCRPIHGERLMAVRRIVTNIATNRVEAAKAFYGEVLGLTIAMDLGWIITFTTDAPTTPQISMAAEGESGTPVPDISIEVDNLEECTGARSRRPVRSNTAQPSSPGASSASMCAIRLGDCSTSSLTTERTK